MERITLKFLNQSLADDERMIDWLMNEGLISDVYACPKCGEKMKLNKRTAVIDGRAWRCSKRGENKHEVSRSIRKGTWFEDSHLSVRQILSIVYMWCMKASTDFIMREVNITEHTVVDWKRFCREVCVTICVNESEMLGGTGVIVEIDESEFKTSKDQRGKHVEGRWVFGGIERGTDKCFMCVVPDRSKDVLLGIIKEYVRPSSTVVSGCWHKYDCLNDEGYENLTVNYDILFKNPDNTTDANTIERTWTAVKRSMRNNHAKKYDNYLFEYMWRQKHKASSDLVRDFLNGIKSIYPPATHD